MNSCVLLIAYALWCLETVKINIKQEFNFRLYLVLEFNQSYTQNSRQISLFNFRNYGLVDLQIYKFDKDDVIAWEIIENLWYPMIIRLYYCKKSSWDDLVFLNLKISIATQPDSFQICNLVFFIQFFCHQAAKTCKSLI